MSKKNKNKELLKSINKELLLIYLIFKNILIKQFVEKI
jgi:hypothetical protein